jgi:hypothetical protein
MGSVGLNLDIAGIRLVGSVGLDLKATSVGLVTAGYTVNVSVA